MESNYHKKTTVFILDFSALMVDITTTFSWKEIRPRNGRFGSTVVPVVHLWMACWQKTGHSEFKKTVRWSTMSLPGPKMFQFCISSRLLTSVSHIPTTKLIRKTSAIRLRQEITQKVNPEKNNHYEENDKFIVHLNFAKKLSWGIFSVVSVDNLFVFFTRKG